MREGMDFKFFRKLEFIFFSKEILWFFRTFSQENFWSDVFSEIKSHSSPVKKDIWFSFWKFRYSAGKPTVYATWNLRPHFFLRKKDPIFFRILKREGIDPRLFSKVDLILFGIKKFTVWLQIFPKETFIFTLSGNINSIFPLEKKRCDCFLRSFDFLRESLDFYDVSEF